MEKSVSMTNAEIYSIADALALAFETNEEYLPAKISFYIQKNRSLFQKLKTDIEMVRIKIADNYGALNQETNQYTIPPEKIGEAQRELSDLFNLKQSVQFNTLQLNDIESLQFTSQQMQAILFMIEEE